MCETYVPYFSLLRCFKSFLPLQFLIAPNARQSYFNLTPASQHVVSWAVVEGVTMELTIARVSKKCLNASPPIYLFIYLFTYISIYLSIYLCIFASVRVSILASVCLYFCLSASSISYPVVLYMWWDCSQHLNAFQTSQGYISWKNRPQEAYLVILSCWTASRDFTSFITSFLPSFLPSCLPSFLPSFLHMCSGLDCRLFNKLFSVKNWPFFLSM